MRSRYTAFVLAEAEYVRATWHASTRPEEPDLAPADGTRWLGLDVKRHELTGEGNAIVEFVARYKIGGRAFRMHETSRFVREGGRWYYVDGQVHSR